ncbi:MAG: binding-protein-dependent transport system inner rane component [Rhodospirillales bacterium]|nr:binding-protein-dependent transport system inner rane component [Rhodospirillales bacterium]
MIRNRVLFVLVLTGIAAAFFLAFLTHAPNRLLTGSAIPLSQVAHGRLALGLAVALPLLLAPFPPQRPWVHVVVIAAAGLLQIELVALAGSHAADLAAIGRPAERTSLGGAFWILILCAALAIGDAQRRLGRPFLERVLMPIAVAGIVAFLAARGLLDQLSLARELATRRDAFLAAAIRHVVIVAAALLPTLVIGVPLGILAQRHLKLRNRIFPFLNIVQTIPSIALFGLLIGPLSALAALSPGLAALGISGIGLAPAILALVLYSLLPIVRNTVAGLDTVPAAIRDAGSGLGMTPRQLFWRVELPLALPVFLAGLRITTVQAIGLAAVAALIGAGGLGAIVFQGLFANAQDLVLLGTLPLIALALLADALLRLITQAATRTEA